jgi:hypothetical protein
MKMFRDDQAPPERSVAEIAERARALFTEVPRSRSR